MLAYEVLKRFQIGVEATPGTPVAANILTGGTLQVNSDYAEMDMYRTGFGQRLPAVNTAYVKRYKADGLRADVPPAPSLLAYLLRAGVNGSPTVTEITQDGGDYKHSFIQSMDIKTLTGEAGTNAVVYQLPYMLLNGFTLSGNAADGTCSLSLDLQAQKRERKADSFTTPGVTPTVYLNGALVKLYKGENEIAKAVVDWELAYKTGANGKRTGGSLYYTNHGFGAIEVTLSLGLEHTDAVALLEEDYLNREVLTIAFEIDSGITIGNTETTQKVRLSGPAILTEFGPFGKTNEENAIDSAVFTFGYIVGVDNPDPVLLEVITDHA